MKLFTTEGIRVIGIDRVLREADVAKASLYSLFGSKDGLVAAYITQLDIAWRESWEKRTEHMNDPMDKVLAFFDQCIDEEPQKGFRGSYFHNAFSEYPRPEAEGEKKIVEAVLEHRRWCTDTLSELITALIGFPSQERVHEVLIYLDGGLVSATFEHSIEPLVMARQLAQERLAIRPADYVI